MIPSVRAATTAGTVPLATRTVETSNRAGTHAARAPSANNIPTAAAETAAPPRDSRTASVLRAVASRLDRVPSGSPSCRAASLRLRPSSSHSTTGSRYFSGRRASSRSSNSRSSR